MSWTPVLLASRWGQGEGWGRQKQKEVIWAAQTSSHHYRSFEGHQLGRVVTTWGSPSRRPADAWWVGAETRPWKEGPKLLTLEEEIQVPNPHPALNGEVVTCPWVPRRAMGIHTGSF